MTPVSRVRRHVSLLLLGVLVTACASTAGRPDAPGPRVMTGPARLALAAAIRSGRDLGPAAAATPLHLTLSLQVRDRAGLDALLASGRRITVSDYAARFGPSAATAASVTGLLDAAGMTATWTPGATSMTATASVGAADRLLATRIDDFVAPDGTAFHAPVRSPVIPESLRGIVTAVTGLENYSQKTMGAVRSRNGLTPADVLDFYDVNPLVKAGLDGTGQTIAFIEGDTFAQADLDSFTREFSLPPLNVDVKTDPQWGTPDDSDHGEAELDLEVAHEIAPQAHLVVYYASAQNATFLAAEQAMYRDVAGKIVSSSWSSCEVGADSDQANAINDMAEAASAQATTIFVASMDRGAYCAVREGDNTDLSPALDGGVPSVTSVGGTDVLLSATGGYYKEGAWGEPAEQWGSGGGISLFFKRPAWQTGPGVDNPQYPNQMRETPDVSADADIISGWDVVTNGSEGPVGGTSAAAPFWAAVTALIDQDLAQKHLASIGFANPALYLFGRNPAGLPAPAFHDVAVGTNLYYIATPGYDMATGLGTPDVASLMQDFEWYERSQHGAAAG